MADTACWVLTNADGVDLDQDGVPHFPSEKHAKEQVAKIEGDEVFKPRRLDHLCVTLACSCCHYVYDEDEDGVLHFASMAEAEKALANFWKLTRDETLCPYCTVGPCDREAGNHG
jgi:hypothetical protein